MLKRRQKKEKKIRKRGAWKLQQKRKAAKIVKQK